MLELFGKPGCPEVNCRQWHHGGYVVVVSLPFMVVSSVQSDVVGRDVCGAFGYFCATIL